MDLSLELKMVKRLKKSLPCNLECRCCLKRGYEDFMLKQIHEQPKAVRDTLAVLRDWQRQGAMV